MKRSDSKDRGNERWRVVKRVMIMCDNIGFFFIIWSSGRECLVGQGEDDRDFFCLSVGWLHPLILIFGVC